MAIYIKKRGKDERPTPACHCITNDGGIKTVIGLKHEAIPPTLPKGIAGRSNTPVKSPFGGLESSISRGRSNVQRRIKGQ